MKNTLKQGLVRNIIFKEKNDETWYAVGLEFNIVVEGDSPEIAYFNLQEAIAGYVESLNKSKIGGLRTDHLLNQKPDSDYENLWSLLNGNKPIPSPYQHTRASHHYYIGSSNGILRQVTVAFHGKKTIKPRTMKSIILQSGIPKETWLK